MAALRRTFHLRNIWITFTRVYVHCQSKINNIVFHLCFVLRIKGHLDKLSCDQETVVVKIFA